MYLHRVFKMYQSFVTATHVSIGKRKFDVSPQSIQNVSIICNSNPCVHGKEEV